MSKKKSVPRHILIFALILQFIVIMFLWTFVTSDDVTNKWFNEASPNNKYIISADQLGTPFLNGPTKILVSLYNNDEKITILEFIKFVRNDGNPLDETNYSITWHEEYAMLTLFNYDKTYSKFRFYWEDY